MSLGTRIFPKPLPANSKNSQLIFPSKSSNRLRKALDYANADVKFPMGEAAKFYLVCLLLSVNPSYSNLLRSQL